MLQILNLLLSLMIYRLGNSLQRKRRRSTKYSVSTVSFLIESLKIDITFITSVSSKATDLYRLLLNLETKLVYQDCTNLINYLTFARTTIQKIPINLVK